MCSFINGRSGAIDTVAGRFGWRHCYTAARRTVHHSICQISHEGNVLRTTIIHTDTKQYHQISFE